MKVLVADDDSVNRTILETFITRWGCEVVSAADGDEAWRILQAEDAPRLAILDWMMPGMDGIEICRQIRKRGSEPYTYIVLLTARFQKADILTGLEAGADDYLPKPFDSAELRARLRTGRRLLELQEQLILTRDSLKYQASHDSMTGIWNYASILDILEAELARSKRANTPVCVAMLDLDFFKKVNDCHGHLAGDAVLRETARRLRVRLRPYDFVGRYGGEEFLIVLPGIDEETALQLAERVRLTISETPIDIPEGRIALTASIGLASNSAGQTESATVIHAADLALYRAKRLGRNRVEAHWAARPMNTATSLGEQLAS